MIEEISFKECPSLNYLPLHKDLPVQKFGLNLTSVILSECKSVDNKFVQVLTQVTGSNLRKLDISYTSADCLVLLCLAGYSLDKVFEMETSEEIDTDRGNCSDNNYGDNNDNGYEDNIYNGDNEALQVAHSSQQQKLVYEEISCKTMNSSSDLCDVCLCVKKGKSPPEILPCYLDEYEVIEYMIPCKSKTKHNDWEIISMVSETESLICQCSETFDFTTTPPLHQPPQHQSPQQSQPQQQQKHQLFQPNLIYVSMENIDLCEHKFGNECFELFLSSNRNLEHLFISCDDSASPVIENLDCIIENEIHLKTFHLSKTTMGLGLNMDKFMNHSQCLVDFELDGNPADVSDTALIQLIKQNLNIRRLSLADTCTNDDVVLAIANILNEKVGLQINFQNSRDSLIFRYH